MSGYGIRNPGARSNILRHNGVEIGKRDFLGNP